MTLGLIARADDGGLGSLTWEVWRHLQPAKTLVVLTEHRTRGHADLSRYPGARTVPRLPNPHDLRWLFEGVDVVYTAETWYSRHLPGNARTVLHAMPEMHGSETADRVYVPTSWRADLVPEAELLPFPVALDRFPRRKTGGRTMYHVASNAFHDRNGTELLLDAVQHLAAPSRLLIRNPQGVEKTEVVGRCDVRWIGHHHGPYFEAWPADIDLFVMPRRFGGLCLPMQEAAALGLPIVTLDLDPQNAWLPDECLVPATVETKGVHMKGGFVDVHTCDPEDLAERIELAFTADLGDQSRAWAESISWDQMEPSYRQILG